MQSNWFSKAICFLLLFNFHYLNAQDCIGGMAGGYPCSDIALRSEISLAALGLGEGNDIWGWQSPDTGREYAIVGGEQGTAFIDVTDAANAWIVGRLARPGSRSFWRDMKVLDNYVYLGSEGSGSGMQVFDLTELDAITTPPSSPPIFEEEDNNTSDFISTSHNIIANPETGLLMAVGTNRCSGGLVMYDVAADPTDPPQQSCFSADGYTHDAVCFIYRGMDTEHIGKEICIAFNEDTYTIVDVTDRNNPVMISRSTYSNSAYSHQGWITDDHRYLVLNDENDERLGQVSKTRTMFFDLADLDAPTPHMTYFANSNAIDHNLYIRGNYVYQANYKAGVRILDISDLANQNVTEVAYFDIFPANDRAEFSGAWSIYPYFDNNKLLVSSILEGFYALEFDADHFFIRKTGTGIVTVPQNSSQNYDIELVTLGNFSGQVSLNVIGLPPGATASAKPVETTSKSMSTVTLSINIPANTPVGNYSLIVEGDSPGMDTQRLAVGLVVEADVCANFQSCMPIEYSHSQNNGNTPSPTRPTKPTKSK